MLASIGGEPGQSPVKPRSGQGDHQTGLAAYSSILTALLLRNKTDKGSLCETSLIRCASWNMGEDLACTLVDRVQPRKTVTEQDGVSTRCYECSDERWIIVMMPFRDDYYWPRFCEALGKSEWAEAEEYSTPSKRGTARVEVTAQPGLITLPLLVSDW